MFTMPPAGDTFERACATSTDKPAADILILRLIELIGLVDRPDPKGWGDGTNCSIRPGRDGVLTIDKAERAVRGTDGEHA